MVWSAAKLFPGVIKARALQGLAWDVCPYMGPPALGCSAGLS